MSFMNLIDSLNEQYAKPAGFQTKKVSYGTAGFRTNADHLDWVMYRIGMLACLRSVSQKLKWIGCMITASHNPEHDNGCKLVDPLGDMLEEKWEVFATELVNSNDLKATLKNLCQNEFKEFMTNYDYNANKANLVVAHDTRRSSKYLLEAFSAGVKALNGNLINYGLLTTPQLHYMVRCLNTNNKYGQPNEDGYYAKLSQAFYNVWTTIEFEPKMSYETDLYVDAANGIGAEKIKTISKLISSMLTMNQNDSGLNGHHEFQPQLNIHLFNEAKQPDDILNNLCGADHVKTQQKPPIKLPVGEQSIIRKYCSFDGDADRIVYYYLDKNNKNEDVFHLLDGDKISTLIATQLKELIESSNLSNEIDLCIVQTAYANGSSTDYIENSMKVKSSCVPTGVKHLHHEAYKYDVGVYFEANGHGTIIFSEKAENLIEQKYSSLIEKSNKLDESFELKKLLKENPELNSLYILKNLKDCINQTVGDAISDLLVVELILAMRNLDVRAWDKLYTDLPSRQSKVTIKDRNVIKTFDAERRVSEPAELQTELDKLVKNLGFINSRSFVRPSGTEDVVRVYAEADTQQHADDLALKVSQLVYDLAGGVGKRP